MADDRIRFGDDTLVKVKSKEGTNGAYKRRISVHETDAESTLSASAPRVREGDFKQQQTFKGWTLLLLAYQATGVIYGDIGTSPLYVYSSTFSDNPSREDMLGAVSLIIWTLTLIVTVKYVFIVLRADDQGEGGTFAIYTLLSRFSDIMKRDPRVNNLVKMERHETNELHPHNKGVRDWLEKSKIAHACLKILAVFGVSLILADGVLTPAQSVLGAIQGIRVANPNLGTPTIVGVSCAILVALFLVQPLGVHRVSFAFAPIVIIWLLLNGSFGIYNLAVHDYTILKAFSPSYAGSWFMRNKTDGWISLGGILLCFTGVECLFADMGAFSRRAVQISWLFLAYPTLILSYVGQAYMLDDPSAWANPFFQTVPPGMFYPSLVFAILAAIVASQATITACFQLLSQAQQGSYFPHITTIYTSDKFHAQVYIPIANWLLMIGCVIVTAVYNNTTRLGQAYGVCVIFVTFITTNLVALAAIIVWRIHPAIVFVVWLPFVTLDGLYLSASLTKVPSGAWFTLLLAAILAAFFITWRYGKEKQWACEAKEKNGLSSLVLKSAETGKLAIAESYGGGDLAEIDGFGVFFDKAGAFTPKVYEQWIQKFRAQMDVVVLMHMRALSIPHVSDEDRFEVTNTSVKNVYRLIIRHGYSDHVITPDLASLVYEEVRKAILRGVVRPSGSSTSSGEKPFPATEDLDAVTAARLRRLDDAYAAQCLYLVGKQQMRINPNYNIFKKMVLGIFLWVRENSRSKIEKLNVPVEKLVEVGFVGQI